MAKQTGKQKTKTGAVNTADLMSKMTANQKITFLLNQVNRLNGLMQKTNQENQSLKAALTHLDNRILAIIKAGDSGAINSASVKSVLVNEATEKMARQTESFKKMGLLVEANDSDISENSYVIGREVDKDGNVQNPRIHILVKDTTEEVKAKMLGSKVGSILEALLDPELNLEVLENYTTVDQQAAAETEIK